MKILVTKILTSQGLDPGTATAWEKVLCSVFDLAVLNPSDIKRHDTHVSLLLRIKRWDPLPHENIMSTSCHCSYHITPFLHELNTLDAC